MRIIKLNATQSTNDYLRALTLDISCEDFTVVTAKEQTKGKGQMGSVWTSKAGENLMFSVYKTHLDLKIEDQFVLSVISSLALYKALRFLDLKKLAVKWPNDILAEQQKICGVLIENVIKSDKIKSCIIGIGLNVNQLYFDHLPKAASLKKLTGKHYNLDEILQQILKALDYYFKQFIEVGIDELLKRYNGLLFRKEKPSTFKTIEGYLCVGIIQGVDTYGRLIVLFEDDIEKRFNLKEIQLLY